MRIAATEKLLTAMRAAGRTVEAVVYVKKTASRSELITAGTWTNVIDYVSKKELPSFQNNLEINLSQFAANKTSLKGLGIQWWDANVFNYANFLEVKIDYVISGITAEPITVFAGWIKKKKNKFDVKRFEKQNNVKFDVWSYADYADETHVGNSMAVQYIHPDCNGAGTDGLVLHNIADVFVTDANIAGFTLKKGVHVITYSMNTAGELKLDDGDPVAVTATNSYYTLANKKGDQKVKLWYGAPTASGDYTDDIIVTNEGDAIPKTWYKNVAAGFHLTKLFERAGITTLSLDTLEGVARDGLYRVSFLDSVANNLAFNSEKYAIAGDGTSLWFGADNHIYKRTNVTGEYVLKCSLGSTEKIQAIDMIVEKPDHLWIFTFAGKLYRYVISTNTLSSSINVVSLTSPSNQKFHIFYDASTGEYCVLYFDSSTSDLKRVDGDSLAVTTLFHNTLLGGYSFFRLGSDATKVWIAGNGNGWYEYQWNGSAWQSNGSVSTVNSGDYRFAYNAWENRIYFYDTTTGDVKSHPASSTTITTITTLPSAGSDVDDAVYYSALHQSVFIAASDNVLHKFSSNNHYSVGTGVHTKHCGLRDHAGRLYGLDVTGKLFHHSNRVPYYIPTADYEGMTVRGAIEKICSSFSLIYSISSTKSARVLRRSDANGDAVTSGNVVALTSDNVRDISDESFYGDSYDIVKLSNGDRSVFYDGTIYDAEALNNEKVLPIESEFIPDEILEDRAYNDYLFFSLSHKVYSLPSPAALIQYECLDGATIVHDGNMVLNESGIIVSDSIEKPPGGRPEFKILVNA